ncbi:uncharacterized protein L201_002526 [Kwoniella dendrophila CBS 6074]|uniref:Pentacotripeptide-repeat region of PRORP domain-containing protein n=1 Tax=Kwoniella dendrophila CBS 6074 TaxID=1295534 RepID=A0AAX4JRB4_9TREE
MLTKATAHFRPFIRLPSSSGASPDHFTANPSLLHHLPHNGAGNSLVAQGANPTQTAGSSGSTGRHGYGGNAGAGGGYTGHARAFLSLPQTASVDPSSTLSNSDDNSIQDANSLRNSSLLLKHRLSKRTRIIGPSDGVGREVRREIEARAGGSKVTVMELEGLEDSERFERLALPTSGRSRRRTGLTRSPSAIEIWQVGIPKPRGRLGLRSLSTRSDIPRSLEAEDLEPLVSASSTPATRVLGQPNRVLMDLAGRDLPGKRLGMVRRNSTAAVERTSLDQPPVELLLQQQDEETSKPSRPNADPKEIAIYDALISARDSGDSQLVEQLIRHYRSPRSVSPFSEDKQPGDPALHEQYPLSSGYSLRTYNGCLSALMGVRKPGQSIAEILEIYNEILERDFIPDNKTYGFVIRALSLRSVEVQDAIRSWEDQKSWGQWRALLLGPETWNFNAAAEKDHLFQSYEAEGNLPSALKLFRAATRVNSAVGFPLSVYGTLLTAMSRQSQPDIKAMEQIINLAQRWKVPGSISLHRHLFKVYGESKDVKGLDNAWADFKKASAKGNPEEIWSGVNPTRKAEQSTSQTRAEGIRQESWNNAISAYISAGKSSKSIEILDEMMKSTTNTPTESGPTNQIAPSATHRTLGQVVVDLAKSGEIDLALEWNDKFHSPSYLGKMPTSRLTLEHTTGLIDILIKSERLDDAKKVVQTLSNSYDQFNTPASKTTVGKRLWRIYTVLVVRATELPIGPEREALLDEIRSFSKSGRIPLDMSVLTKHTALLSKSERWDDLILAIEAIAIRQSISKEVQSKLISTLIAISQTEIPLNKLLTLTHRIFTLGVQTELSISSAITSKILTRDSNEKLDITNQDLLVLLGSFNALPQEKVSEGDYDDSFLSLISILEQVNKENNLITEYKDHPAVQSVIKSIVYRFGVERSNHLLTPVFGEQQAKELTDAAIQSLQSVSSPSSAGSPESPVSSEFTPPSSVTSETDVSSTDKSAEYTLYTDKAISAKIERFTHRNPPITPLQAYELVKEGLSRNAIPYISVLCSLIDHLSRFGEESKVRELYELCQVILNKYVRPENKISSWHQVEDSMLIANCHLGYLEQAGLHRSRIIEQGLSPSADSYATMIASSKDTTDDALIARELFDESQLMGVKPHLYLYNTIISKLSKARKAETALELFKHMKNQGIKPSSVTYGAVINACCRVGDAQSAETLFEEMASQRNFKARVPPYNTMMQFYLQTQPNRSRVLHFYHLLQQANVPPSAHTYKLLLDTYATLPPIDLEAMENVFKQIQQDKNVQVQGTHWASLINAYGIFGNDLVKSQEIFESLSNTKYIKEAVVWESILNVLSQKGTLEELESTKDKLFERNDIQSTAYVYNALINGYSRLNEIKKSRELFNSMGDSISGVAAPNNHPTLLTSSGHQKPSTQTLQPTTMVYREPSTYESMLKAELKAGETQKAKQVLDQMEKRNYPYAVFAKAKAAFDEALVSSGQSI